MPGNGGVQFPSEAWKERTVTDEARLENLRDGCRGIPLSLGPPLSATTRHCFSLLKTQCPALLRGPNGRPGPQNVLERFTAPRDRRQAHEKHELSLLNGRLQAPDCCTFPSPSVKRGQ